MDLSGGGQREGGHSLGHAYGFGLIDRFPGVTSVVEVLL